MFKCHSLVGWFYIWCLIYLQNNNELFNLEACKRRQGLGPSYSGPQKVVFSPKQGTTLEFVGNQILPKFSLDSRPCQFSSTENFKKKSSPTLDKTSPSCPSTSRTHTFQSSSRKKKSQRLLSSEP